MVKDYVTIIAEAGVNHNGDINIAKQLIEAAAEADVDYIKFQMFNPEKLVTPHAELASYQVDKKNRFVTQLDLLRNLRLSYSMYEEILLYCKNSGLGCFATGFSVGDIIALNRLGQNLFKIPSGEITNLPYLRHVGHYGKSIYLSTGMADLPEVEAALEVLTESGTPRDRITVLHCHSHYPTCMEDVNLRAMLTLRDQLNVSVGYSDHTLGIEVSIAAAALGAVVIEKHLTLDRNMKGPDHRASIEPDELGLMTKSIRNVKSALGEGIKRPSSQEIKTRSVVRKSLVAATPIKKGDVFSDRNLTTKRPGSGISPMLWDDVLGGEAPRDFIKDELIEL